MYFSGTRIRKEKEILQEFQTLFEINFGPKCKGGLGIRKTENVNASILAKQGDWKVQHNQTMIQLMRATYHSNNLDYFSNNVK